MGFYAGQELPGTIVIEESLTPFNKKAPERDLKIAGETGIVCRVGDSLSTVEQYILQHLMHKIHLLSMTM
jgi:hypothetical protein